MQLGILKFVGVRRLELPTPCTPCKCASQLRHTPNSILQRYNFFQYKRRNKKFLFTSAIPLPFNNPYLLVRLKSLLRFVFGSGGGLFVVKGLLLRYSIGL